MIAYDSIFFIMNIIYLKLSLRLLASENIDITCIMEN